MCFSPLIVLEYFDTRHRAIDAISLTWDNSHLKLILAHDNLSASNEPHSTNNINTQGQPLWHGKYCESNLFFFFSLFLSLENLKKRHKKRHFQWSRSSESFGSALVSHSLSPSYYSTHNNTEQCVRVFGYLYVCSVSVCLTAAFCFYFIFFYLSVCCGHLIRFFFFFELRQLERFLHSFPSSG